MNAGDTKLTKLDAVEPHGLQSWEDVRLLVSIAGAALTFNSITAIQPIDAGQIQTIVTSVTGGSSPVYNVIVYNSVNQVANQLVATSGTVESNTFAFSQNPVWGSGTFTVNAIITQQTGPTKTVSGSINYNVNPSQIANILLESNTIIDVGQSSTLTAGATGGSPGYTFNWFSQASCAGGSIGSGTTLSVSPTSTTTYSYNVVDSATTNVAVCSSSNSITVYSAPTTNLHFTGSNSITYPATAIANDIVSGGSGSFSWAWTINNQGTANTAVSATQTSNTFIYPTVGSYTYNVAFTDTGTTTHYSGSQVSNVLVVSQNSQPNNALSFSLTPTYSYNSPIDNYLGSTPSQIFNLLSYAYGFNALSYYGINTIKVSFGTNSLSLYNSISLSSSPSLSYSNTIWNEYQNNAITIYNAVITINDIYGDILSNTITFTTNTFVYPQVTAPRLYLNPPTYSISTYSRINSPIIFNAIQDSLPLANVTLYPDGRNSLVISASSFNALVANSLYQYLAYYNYPSNTAVGGLTINAIVTDIAGFSSPINSTTGDTVLTYSPGSTTLNTATGYANVNISYSFSISSGTYGIKTVNIYWGDGTNSIASFATAQTSNTFSLSHKYLLPQTYSLTAYTTDNSPNGGIVTSTLSNPTLTASSYVLPSVVSVTPSTRYNGANDNTENFTFYLQEGTAPLKNITIHWNDGITSLNYNAMTSFTTLTGGQLSFSIIHTFPLPTAYPTNATICDTNKICVTYPTFITIGNPPLSQNSLGQSYNNTNKTINEQNLNQSSGLLTSQDPTETIAIGALVMIIGSVAILGWWRIRKRNKR